MCVSWDPFQRQCWQTGLHELETRNIQNLTWCQSNEANFDELKFCKYAPSGAVSCCAQSHQAKQQSSDTPMLWVLPPFDCVGSVTNKPKLGPVDAILSVQCLDTHIRSNMLLWPYCWSSHDLLLSLFYKFFETSALKTFWLCKMTLTFSSGPQTMSTRKVSAYHAILWGKVVYRHKSH